MKHYGILLVVFLLNFTISYSQTYPADTIHSEINTGNPKFPFPQFLEYNSGKTLAANNAEGVTHADMEKTMREAYQIMMHRCLYNGKLLKGKKYIVYNHKSVPGNNNTFVSEGDGYALLAAAYFADKEAFDGLWLWIHDNRMSKVKKYSGCTDLRPNYPHGANMPCWDCNETTDAGQTIVNSATDGDYDIAMGLLIAYAQWGDNMGIADDCGQPISYEEEALKVIKALVDTVDYTKTANGAAAGSRGFLTGDIGVDGYCKNGNTWNEITGWRTSAANTAYAWAKSKPDPLSISTLYTDYIGPAYFNQFARFLTTNGGTPWQINQFKRGEASSDWLMGQMYAKGYIASSGNCTVSDDGATTTFGQHPSGPDGEDFRAAWRTILNYVWHGDPTTTWNPVTHEVVVGGNTFEKDMGLRHADFLKNPRTLPSASAAANCEKMGLSPDPSSPLWKGVANIKQAYLVTGALGANNYRTNYNVGTGAPAAVASGDLELVGEIYRQSEIMWDDVNTAMLKTAPDEERYIKSTPKYFHDWFRLLGMLTTSGNLHPFGSMVPAANLKVYLSVDKTYAYAGDLVTYTVSYRNYGSVDAAGVTITTPLGSNYDFVSATKGGTVANGGVAWAIGTVPGFKSAAGIAPTQGSVSFTVRVKAIAAPARACLTSSLSSTNAPSWTSNEFPNNASYTMERNCVDLLPARSLNITKTTDRAAMNPGDVVNFKLDFENKSAPDLWLNGGRDKIVVSYGNYYLASNTFYQFYRFWHSAPEAYVNMGNYRVSYFLNDPAAVGLYNAATNPTGWAFSVDNQNDLDKYFYNPSRLPADQRITFSHQEIPWGSNAGGSWNQRIMIRFANVLTAPTTHIYDKLDNMYLIHRGVIGPGFIRTKMESTPPSSLAARLTDDWSYSSKVDIGKVDGQDKRLSPITSSWANPAKPDVPVTNYSKDVCDPDVPNYDKLLVEEFDGYTWRRIAGSGPLPGRETYNVQVIDTIPKELTWDSFTDAEALGITATYTPAAAGAAYSGIVQWVIPVMQVGAKGDLGYKLKAKELTPPCPGADRNFMNIGYILSQTDSPDTSGVKLKITCNPVPPTQPKETSLHKSADKKNVQVGEVVTYKVEFKNTDGATAVWATNTAQDWQILGTGTTMPDMNKPAIDLDQNGNTSKPGAKGYAFGHNKSHGINGYLEATIDVSNSSSFSFIFRHSAGTPGQADFQGVALKITPNPVGPNTINFEVLNNATSLTTLTNISYGGSGDPISFHTELIDDQLYIWINNFKGAPLKVIGGITALKAGYAGVYTSGAQQKITAWKTHFDSAFDLIITDPVPEQLKNITAISNLGTVSGNTVTWPAEPGPIPGGTSIVRTFQATVSTCKDFITNVANASIYGNANIPSQNIIRCGADPCTAPGITSKPTASICTGVAQNYTITSDISTAAFTWSRAAVVGISNTAVTGQTTSSITETLVNMGTSPVVVRYIIIPANGSCTGTPFNYDVTVNSGSGGSTTETDSICSKSPLNYTIKGDSGTSTWTRPSVTNISNPAVTGLASNPITETLINTGTTPIVVVYQITENGAASSCSEASYNYNVTVNPAPMVTSPDSGSICTDMPHNYAIVSNISTTTFTWNRLAVSGISNAPVTGQTANPIAEVLSNTSGSPVVVRYIITPSGAGCPGISFNYDLTVSPIPAINSADTGTICSGAAQNYKITSTVNSATYTWSRKQVAGISNEGVTSQSSNIITENLLNTNNSSAKVQYVIIPAVGNCTGSPFNYNVTVNPSIEITAQPDSAHLCEGAPISLNLVAKGMNLTFQWKKNGADISGATSTTYSLPVSTPENAGKYTVVIQGTCGPVTSRIVEVSVSSTPSNDVTVKGSNICQETEGTVTVLNSQKGVTYQAFSGDIAVSNAGSGNNSDLVLSVNSSALKLGSNTISLHANGCSNIVLAGTAIIQVTPVPVANAGADTLLDKYVQISLNGQGSSQGAYSYQWTSSVPGTVIDNPSSIVTTVLTKTPSTDFTLVVSDLSNTFCKASDVVNIKVSSGPLTVPDAFSPNGDGIHDLFEIPDIKSYPNALFSVYNQWGELIFKSNPGYTVLWDGTRNEKPVPLSAYYYILELNDGSNTEFSGSITIIK